MFNVVLVEPEIPPNTGNVGRLCLATKSTLHLVKPFGFSLEDRELKRAGLDYWEDVDLRIWGVVRGLAGPRRHRPPDFFLTTKTKRAYYDVQFNAGDFLVFGRETKGLPESLLADNIDNCLTIPMHGHAEPEPGDGGRDRAFRSSASAKPLSHNSRPGRGVQSIVNDVE